MKAGTRIAVVGASSGLGRTIGLGLAERGAQVALLARRKDRLDAAVTEANGRATAVRCDVTDEESCRSAIDEAARALGGIDVIVYATGTMTVAPLESVDSATWAHLFATNVTGAALTTAASLPHLQASRGVAVYLSSISALGTPWRNIGSYVASKAALDKLVDAWRVEQPDVRFTRLAVGDCAGGDGDSASEFLNAADQQLAHESILEWLNLGHMTGNLIDPTDLIDTVESIVTCRASIPTVTLAPHSGAG